MTLFEMFLRGGSIMWFILACSVLAVAIIVQKLLVLSRARVDAGKFLLQLRSVLSRGDVRAAMGVCTESSTPLAMIMRSGLMKIGAGHEDVKEAIEAAARAEVYRLEKGLALLASIAGVAPLLGFLGTVTGMISAFRVIEENAGTVNPQLLAGGVWEALLTTAFGLIVGIPVYFIYNYFVTRVKRFVHETEVSCNDFLDILETEIHSRPSA